MATNPNLTTNVPQPTFSPLGFQIPTDDQILSGVLADLNAAFGGNLNITNLATPQGQLASSMAAIIANADQTFLFYTTQTDPAYAEGRMQDAIGRIYFMERLPAEPTIVTCNCVGAANTVIPAGALAQDAAGNIYAATTGGTIPSGGTLSLQFANQAMGPIPCPANSLTIIYKAIPGWDTISNPTAGVLGQDTESRSAFETRRIAAVQKNSIGSLPSILGAVLNVAGVTSAYATENATGSPVTIGNVTLAAYSLYVAAVGGSDSDVAQAIWSKKAPGCAYNGNTNVTVYDTSPGYTAPYPSYAVKFQRPSNLTIYFALALVPSIFIPSNAPTLIQNAIIAAFSGEDGGPPMTIGTNVLASRFYSTIAALGAWAQIASLFLASTVQGSAWAGNASIAGTTLTVNSTASGALAIGQILTDITGNLTPGTQIVSGSGTTWEVNYSQTVASENMTALTLNQLSIQAGIDQIPVTQDTAILIST